MPGGSTATTIRFSEDVYSRLDQAATTTGLPINSIVIMSCIYWLDSHAASGWTGQDPSLGTLQPLGAPPFLKVPRASTLARIARAVTSGRRVDVPGGAGAMYPFERFTEPAKKALLLAQEEATSAGHPYLGTEHLLLGVVTERNGLGAEVLSRLAIREETLRAAIAELLGKNERIRIRTIVPTSRVKRVIELAFEQARSMGDQFVGTEHLLMALVAEGEGIAAKVLERLGASLDGVAGVVEAIRIEAPAEPAVVPAPWTEAAAPSPPEGSASTTTGKARARRAGTKTQASGQLQPARSQSNAGAAKRPRRSRGSG